EVIPLDESHGVVGPAVVVLAASVDGDDARVLQAAGDLGLDDEPGPELRVVGESVVDLLEGHLAIQLGVQGEEDGAQPALGVGAEDGEPVAPGGRASGTAAC